LLLASRVIVFSEWPAHIKAEFTVDLPYPRHHDNRLSLLFGDRFLERSASRPERN